MGAVLYLGLKVGMLIVSVVGISSGVNWYNKKTFKGKGGNRLEGKHWREDVLGRD